MNDRNAEGEAVRANVSRREFIRVGATGLGALGALGALPAAARGEAAWVGRPRAVGPIRVVQTTGALRHAERPALAWSPAGNGPPGEITLFPERRAQEVLGFGAALTDAACYTVDQLPAGARAELFHELYHPSEMAFSVGRTCIGSSDYSTVAYSYDDSPTPDPELKNFSIAHDRKWILPMLRQARAVNPDLWLLSSPWSPPGWMKDNNSLLGGTVRRRYLANYADYVTRFVKAYASEGVAINSVTSQNEVDTDQDSRMPQCTWPQEIEVEFVGKHLGPTFAKAGLATKIWLIDHNYNLWGRALAELQDDDVRRYADGIAWHGYLGSPEEMTRVHDAYPGKHAYWTEGGPDITAPDYQTDWTKWAGTFTGIMRNWARCIIAWNVALDEHGKPNIGPFPCGGVVTIHSATKQITRSGQYWAFAHFSRHVKRGAHVFQSTGSVEGVAHVAFQNPDGSRVLVLANGAKGAVQPRISLGDASVQLSLPTDSVTTLDWPSQA
jgi:glucosylceramidase